MVKYTYIYLKGTYFSIGKDVIFRNGHVIS